MGEWLGHRDLCASQWRQRCDCPCPSCDEPLDTIALACCEQVGHMTDVDGYAAPEPRFMETLDEMERGGH